MGDTSDDIQTSDRGSADWWRPADDDIFAAAADTERQPRPTKFPTERALRRSPIEPPPLPADAVQRKAAPVPAIPPRPRSTALPSVGRVLLADHDPVLLHILGYQLTSLRWEVSTCEDGVEAQRLLRQGGIDVMLIDLDLPYRNAFEVLQHLSGCASRPRVIVMSAQAQEDKIVRAFEQGADDFVQKPLSPRVVVSRIQRLLER